MKWSACMPPLLALGLVSLGAGCGGGRDATEKQLAELQAEVARLRAAQASMGERLDAIDMDRGAFGKGAATLPAAERPKAAATASLAPAVPLGPGPEGDRPELDVVRLSPNEGDGDANNDPSVPVLRAVGDASPRPTLTNKSLGARAPRRGVTPAFKKPADGDARPGARP
jgi:hypothetical protein